MIKNKFINYLQRLWYEFHFLYIITGFRFFFRRWQVANAPKMRRKEPVIYVANHQNAFMDALAIIMSQRRHPVFLTRANIFAHPVASFLLRSYNMLPIYRSRDGGDTKAKNEKVMQDCIDMLIDGRQPIAIFVEGNHNLTRSLRPLKKGVARIAFSAMEEANFDLDLKIVPVGVNYSKHTRFRGDLLVNFGEPIHVNDYLENYKENPNKTFNELTNDVQNKLAPLIVNIENTEHYESIEKAWISERKLENNMLNELTRDQQIIARLTAEKNQGKLLETDYPTTRKSNWLEMILGFPAFIYGTLNHLPFILLMQRITGKYVSDIHFYSSIKLVGGMYIGLAFYILQTIGVYALTDGNLIVSLIYFCTLPFFGTFAYDHYVKNYTDDPQTTSSAELLKGFK